MKNIILLAITTVLFLGCSLPHAGNKHEGSNREILGVNRALLSGIWEMQSGWSKMFLEEDNSFRLKQLAIIDEEDTTELLTGKWAVSGSELILTYDHQYDSSWSYGILSLNDKELVLKHEDYILVWIKSENFDAMLPQNMNAHANQ